MRAIKKVQLFIERNPKDVSAQIFQRLIFSLTEEAHFSITDIYQLDSPAFQLAMEILDQWRLDRYYLGKTKPLNYLNKPSDGISDCEP